ncbi:hypothetical protein ZOSMA_54G00210 [Zostera marina]|uniref:PH domain-containing protein n=1 Tax=Zostera marina TaxID=29655 RepID=A0A0K9NYL4_ZOSMR|nr:hypothetical protein ZOSMA_54G00210 [Zostera marina]
MDDGLGNVQVIQNHFETPPTSERANSMSECSPSYYSRWKDGRKLTTASLLKLFSLPRIPWGSSTDGDDKVEMNVAEVESLKTEISEADEREAYLRAQLEHVDEVLKSARLAGYLYTRTRWTELPGEPPIIDDSDVDDWIQRFVVFHGSCIFYYFQSTDLSPQDTTLISDVVEVGSLPSFPQKDLETRFAFYILTSPGLRFECSSLSKPQVDAWLAILQTACKFGQGEETSTDRRNFSVHG